MQKKQAKVFAGLLSMSLGCFPYDTVAGCFRSSSKKKNALSKKSVTMTVGQKKTIRIKNCKRKAYQMEY